MITPEQITVTFYTLSTIAVSYKLYTWMKGKRQASKSFGVSQFKYFICLYCFEAALSLQGPFTYPLYIKNGLEPKDVAGLHIIFNIFHSFFGFFAGSILSKLGTKYSIITTIMCSFIIGMLRFSGKYWAFVLAQLFCGFSAPIKGIAFESWILQMIESEEEEKECQLAFSENNALINLFVNIITAPLGNYLSKKYEIENIFFGASSFILFDSVLSYLLISTPPKKAKKTEKKSEDEKKEEKEEKKKDEKKNEGEENKGSILYAVKVFSKTASVHSYLMVVIDILYSLFPLFFVPRISGTFIVDGIKYPLALVICTHNVCQLFGAILCTFASKRINLRFFLPHCLFVSAVSQILTAVFYDDKTIAFICLCVIGVANGSATSILLGFRKEIYAAEIRTRIMGLVKFFSAITASVALMFLKKYPAKYIIALSGICGTLCALASVFFARVPPTKEEKKKTD